MIQTIEKPNGTENPEIAKAYLLGVVGVVIFGATLPVTRLALVDYSPWFITFGRAFIASVIAISWLAINKKPLHNRRNGEIFLAGLFVIFGFPGFMSLGLLSIPASSGGIVLGILPLLTALFAAFYAGERQSGKFWMLCVAGALVVSLYAFYNGGFETGNSFAGYFWLMLSGICAAFGYAILGKLSRNISATEVICRALMLNFPMILLGVAWFWESSFMQASITGIIALAYLGLFSMLIGFFAWNRALALGGIGKIGQVQLLQIFVTLLVSGVMLGEVIDIISIGTAVAVTGIVLLSKNL